MRIWHGTTLRRWREIQKTGFLCGGTLPDGTSNRQNWNVSGDYAYFWTEDFIQKDSGSTVDLSEEMLMPEVMRFASESAMFAMADEDADPDYRMVVLEMDTKDLDRQKIPYGPDVSSDHMDHCLQVLQPIPMKMVRKAYVLKSTLSSFLPYFVWTRNGRLQSESGICAEPFSMEMDPATKAMVGVLESDAKRDGHTICLLGEAFSDMTSCMDAWTVCTPPFRAPKHTLPHAGVREEGIECQR